MWHKSPSKCRNRKNAHVITYVFTAIYRPLTVFKTLINCGFFWGGVVAKIKEILNMYYSQGTINTGRFTK